MATTSTRTGVITFTGDVTGTETFGGATNVTSPGQIELKTLVPGTNTITLPTGGSTPKAVTIIPPAANTSVLTLKGVAGDTGVALHLTDATTLALGTGVTTFVLNSVGTATGVRFIWA
jgi:hypothetical protein